MKRIIIVAILFSITFADLNISGDARFRPRLDTKEMSESKTSDLYYLYRARLNLKADIGKKYFLNLKLGTNSIASMTKMGDTNLDAPGIANSSRPNIDFLEQYFGFEREKTGLWMGAFPLKHNPALDIHFYPHKMVDIPWALYNNSTITGIAGYNTLIKHKLNWFISMDINSTNSEIIKQENEDIETTITDGYTLGLNTNLNIGPLKINPYLLYTFTDTNNIAPLTLGSIIYLPTILDINSSFSYYISNNSNSTININDKIEEYTANHIRIKLNRKLGPGSITIFYDIATSDYGSAIPNSNSNNSELKFNYIWLSYNYTLHKNTLGSITLKPTIRMQNGGYPGDITGYDENYKRNKFELTTEFKFK